MKEKNFKIPSISQLEQELLADSITTDLETPAETTQNAARKLTAAQVRHDVSTFARCLINVYGGWPFLPEIQKRNVLIALKKIQNNARDNMTSADLFNQLKPIVEQFSDNHMCLAMGKLHVHTAMAKRARPNVGANIAGDNVVKLEMRGDIAIIAISTIKDYDTYFKPLENQVLDMLGKSSALVVDLRGNSGGNSRATDLLARRLYGAYVPSAKRGFIRATPDSAIVHAHKKKSTWLEMNDGSGTVLAFDDTEYMNAKFASEGPAYRKPIYILTDWRTMSSAEMFCTRMRPHPYVKFVGDNTRGGEVYGDVGQVILGESTIKFVFGCIYRELAQENFELNGYAPDIRVADGADAYDVAMQDLVAMRRLTNNKGHDK